MSDYEELKEEIAKLKCREDYAWRYASDSLLAGITLGRLGRYPIEKRVLCVVACDLRVEGFSQSEIARKLKISRHIVRRILALHFDELNNTARQRIVARLLLRSAEGCKGYEYLKLLAKR